MVSEPGYELLWVVLLVWGPPLVLGLVLYALEAIFDGHS